MRRPQVKTYPHYCHRSCGYSGIEPIVAPPIPHPQDLALVVPTQEKLCRVGVDHYHYFAVRLLTVQEYCLGYFHRE